MDQTIESWYKDLWVKPYYAPKMKGCEGVDTKAKGRKGNNKGLKHELKVEQILEKGPWPSWFLTYRKSTRVEDSKGIDFIIYTDKGEIFLQVKSSVKGAKSFFRAKRSRNFTRITLVVIDKYERKRMKRQNRLKLKTHQEILLEKLYERYCELKDYS